MADPSDDKARWERRYSQKPLERKEPHDWLSRHLDQLPRSGKALDVACGLGRNAFPLAQRGLEVTGVDLSETAIAQLGRWAKADGVTMDLHACDLAQWRWPNDAFDVAIQFYFLDRSLIEKLRDCIKPGGWLLFETATQRNIVIEGLGPKNPDWCLREWELLEMFEDFEVVEFRETDLEGPMAVASLIAQKPHKNV